jgi:signal transduction histidine kinase/CheY-like chemotaxis protein
VRSSLRRRLPWLAVALLACTVLSLRADQRLREQARQNFHRLADSLALQAGRSSQSLEWLALNPEVISVTLNAPTGELLHSYRSQLLEERDSPPTYTLDQTHHGVRVELQGRLPGWPTTCTELPWLVLALTLALAALPSPSVPPSSRGRRTSLDWEIPSTATEGSLVLELDSEMRIQRVSQGVQRFGYSATELIGTPMGDFVERFHPLHHRSLLGVSHAGGGRLDSLVSSTSIQNSAGGIEKVVVTLASPSSCETDELRGRYSRLEWLCEAVCANARDCVVVVDAAGNVIYGNPAFREALGEPESEQLNLLEKVQPGDRLALVDALQAVLGEGKAWPTSLALAEPSTAMLEGAWHALRSPSSDPRGQKKKKGGPVGVGLAVGIFRDVSEARRLASELERTRQRAGHSQKIEALGRMAGGVAHDFNNMLASIVFNLEAAQAALGADSPAQPYLTQVQLAAEKATSVTRQLLLYSRKKPAVPRLVSSHKAIEDALRLTRGVRPEVELVTRLEADPDTVLLDDGQLDQVLLNLVVNAKDAVDPQQGRVEISTETRLAKGANQQPAEQLVIRVKDNGCGIPASLQSKIFEPYFSTKEVGKGTGLGLSTALAIVEKAGGEMVLHSEPGETCFELLLPLSRQAPLVGERPVSANSQIPLVREATPAGEGLPEGVPGQEESSATSGGRLLLVEDELAIRQLLHRLLEAQGYQVTAAADGSSASAALQAGEFDLLLTDLMLPGMSGTQLARCFDEKFPGRPVIYMSGFPGDTLDETELASNARFMAKPFSPQQLLETLSELLWERQAR